MHWLVVQCSVLCWTRCMPAAGAQRCMHCVLSNNKSAAWGHLSQKPYARVPPCAAAQLQCTHVPTNHRSAFARAHRNAGQATYLLHHPCYCPATNPPLPEFSMCCKALQCRPWLVQIINIIIRSIPPSPCAAAELQCTHIPTNHRSACAGAHRSAGVPHWRR
jgi:hypothetical protein